MFMMGLLSVRNLERHRAALPLGNSPINAYPRPVGAMTSVARRQAGILEEEPIAGAGDALLGRASGTEADHFLGNIEICHFTSM
jgi:hypothetical protein